MNTLLNSPNAQLSPFRGSVTIPPFWIAISSSASRQYTAPPTGKHSGPLSASMIAPLSAHTIVLFTWWLKGTSLARMERDGSHVGQSGLLLSSSLGSCGSVSSIASSWEWSWVLEEPDEGVGEPVRCVSTSGTETTGSGEDPGARQAGKRKLASPAYKARWSKGSEGSALSE